MSKITNHLPTAELQALDAAHHMHPFSNNADLAKRGARVITGAKGVMLTDSEGVQILDGMAGLWCVNIGYGRDELAEVAARQMRELPYYNTFFMSTHVPAIALGAKLAQLAPGDLNHVFFASGGSEANDTNIRLVRRYWDLMGKPGKHTFISRKNAYHGTTVGAASLGGMAGMHAQGGLPIPGVEYINQPHWYLEGGDLSPEEFGLLRARELEAKIDELGEENVAAFIAEPIQGAGGVIIPPDSYWPEISRICKERDILLVVDEVITGFGRTGEWFATQFYGLDPDIITIAKGLSSGYAPIGGSLVSDHVAEVVGAGEFNHGYTYSAHPVAAAVALENLRIMEEENIVGHVKNVAGPYLAEKWHQLADHPFVGETTIVGMMASLALTADKSVRKPFEAEAGTVGFMVRERCFANNLVMRHVGDRMVVAPPLTMQKGDIDLLFDLAVKSLDQAYKDVQDAGLMKTA
ncbi:MAG: aspartate aminotransferase family protein [Maritimibacter sp.]